MNAPTGPRDPGTRRARWQHLLDGDAPILADGAMGTQLFAAGLQFGDPPEVWNLSNPEIVRRIHRGYVDAGSRILLTNTFGGNRHRLALHNLEGRVAELNRTAAILLRAEVDAAGSEALVAGDLGPSGLIMAPLGTLERDDAVSAFEEQARELIAGGVDVIWIETMSDLAEITAAVEGVRRRLGGHPGDRDDDVRHARPHDDGHLAGTGGRRARRRSAWMRSAATAATVPKRSSR